LQEKEQTLMKFHQIALAATLAFILSAPMARAASGDVYRQESDAGKMMHKLGRGVVNVLTCWVEVPRNIAAEWEKTDPATGFVLGTVKGFGWGFARLATGVYETFTFPLPVPENYQPMLQPEFVLTDVWGDPIPGISEFSANDPNYPDNTPVYPQNFNF
jgi:putative exosortase-associated protein (TIGR04073 family)